MSYFRVEVQALKNNISLLISVAYFLLCLCFSFLFQGTGDDGDSVMHFLIAKYSWNHPELFLHHWGKPFFTLLASPFAIIGFIGIKVFNSTLAALTCYCTCLLAKRLNINYHWVAGLFIVFTPLYFTLIFSGLTEYLFAFMLVAGIYLASKNKVTLSVTLISFLPFVRSEGLIIILVFASFLLLQKHYKYLPLLLLGSVVYSIAGFSYYQDVLWVFTEIPYHSREAYSSGNWYDFLDKLYYVIGLPLYILLSAGAILLVYKLVNQKNKKQPIWHVLVLGSFLSIIAAHSYFWASGSFHSMGLKRVLIAVVPLIALIAAYAFQFLMNLMKSRKVLQTIATAAVLFYIAAFPLLPNPAAIQFPDDFTLSEKQQIARQAAGDLNKQWQLEKVFCSYPFMIHLLEIDYFSNKQSGTINHALNSNTNNGLIIWDNWFSKTEEGITLKKLERNTKLKKIKAYKNNQGETQIAVFKIQP